jgi:hypothetical protein
MPLALLAVWRADKSRGYPSILAAALLLIQTIAFNWPADAFGYHFAARQQLLLAGLTLAVLAIALLFRWRRGPFYFCFVTLCCFVFGWLATAWYVYSADTIPESRRYALEFELFLY